MTGLDVVGAAFISAGRVLVARRADHKAMAGKWDFPGGKVERNETPREALCRELREEFGIENVDVDAQIEDYRGYIGDVPIRLRTFLVYGPLIPIRSNDHDMHQVCRILPSFRADPPALVIRTLTE